MAIQIPALRWFLSAKVSVGFQVSRNSEASLPKVHFQKIGQDVGVLEFSLDSGGCYMNLLINIRAITCSQCLGHQLENRTEGLAAGVGSTSQDAPRDI